MKREEIDALCRHALEVAEPGEASWTRRAHYLRECVAAIRSFTTWRPMETAPRDGTWILATSQGEPYLVRFSAHAWRDDSGVPSPILNGWLPLVPGPEVGT